MSRRENHALRCGSCRLPRPLCLCAELPQLATRTRVVVVAHPDEEKKPTNTGLLAARSLENSAVVLVGDGKRPVPSELFAADERVALLFPSDDAVPLAGFADGAPLTLVVPDGTWRQAAKLRTRGPGLAELPTVSLPPGPPTQYRLRAEPRPGGLATLEAIARALDLLEGEGTSAPLLALFGRFVDRTLWLRGALSAGQVRGGIPAAAIESGVRGHRPATQRAKAP